MRLSSIFVAIFSLTFINVALADNTLFPLNPRVTLSGNYGDAGAEGNLDGMIPLFGSAQGDVYTDIEGQTGSDRSWYESIGLGGRQALNDNLMLGAYGFVDQTQTISSFGNNANKWVIFNPGIEAMTQTWDARINGYFPVGPNERAVSGDFFGDQIGKPKYVTFQGHQQFDGLFDEIQEIGTGTDADVGYTFKPFRNLRIHGGGYYFQMPNTTNMKGAEAGAEMPLNDYATVAVNDTYDNVQKNTAMLSLKLTLGNIHKTEDGPVTERLLDPIHRHLGTLYTNSSVPSASKMTFSGRKGVLERDNIWFFSGTGGSNFDSSLGNQNCTAEHPCNSASFNQANVNSINSIAPGANLYFNPGNYSLGSASLDATISPFQLNNGQSMYGRTTNYKLPASQLTGYPIFIGGMALQGNNILDSFQMLNSNGNATFAVNISNAINVIMNNLFIGQLNSQYGYATPIFIKNSQDVLLENSTINAFASVASNVNQLFVFGIETASGTGIIVNNNTINVSASGGQILDADGIDNISFPTTTTVLVANRNKFNVMASGGEIATHAAGIFNGNNGMVTLDNNIFKIVANGGQVSAAQGIFNGLSTTNANNNTFDVTVGGGAFNGGSGILYSSGNVNTNYNTFKITANGVANSNVEGIRSVVLNPNVAGNNNTFNLIGPTISTGSNLISGSDNIFICNGINC